jgi:pyruvate dehydrogenase E2 component (dihydrolipoamide acetyltransferase)
VNVTVPDLGDFADVEVIDVLVKPGDTVAVDAALITLETDKATMDVPSPAAGKVSALKVKRGDKVSKGDLIVVLESGSPAGVSSPAGAPAATPAEEPHEPGTAAPAAVAASAALAPPDVAEPGAPALEREPELVKVPDLGDFHDVDVIDVLVAVGDEVAAEQGLITLETDKATMDVPTPVAGRILELRVAKGGTVNPGEAVALIQPSAAPPRAAAGATTRADGVPAPASTTSPKARAAVNVGAQGAPPARLPARSTALPAAGIVDEAAFSRAHASPSVRKLARELGVDLGRVQGRGQKGRITAEDLKAFVKRVLTEGVPGGGLPKVPVVDFAKFGPIATEKLSRIQKISGPRLHASWVNLPHVTQHDEADITELEQRRQALKGEAEKRKLKLTPLAFVMRAVTLTLAEFPRFRSALSADGEDLVVRNYFHIGFAADTPKGLVVPVIRDADRKDVFELAAALATQSARAREGKLSADDVQGGVFTISSLGGIGGTYFTPIINAPEVAILGVSRSGIKPVYDGKQFEPRLMLPLSLSYDHRVIDGAEAARFITRLSAMLGDVDKLVAAGA